MTTPTATIDDTTKEAGFVPGGSPLDDTSPRTEGSAFEELRVDGEQLLAKVRELIHEGNVRRLIIKNGEGATIIEIPLTLGVAGAVILPSLAAVGAIAALVTDCSITVERMSKEPKV